MQAAGSCFAQFSGLSSRPSLRQSTPSTVHRQGTRVPFSVQAAEATRTERRQRRQKRIRNKVEGKPERPRLAVFRSNNHIYAQVIDDSSSNTLAAASTLTPEIRAKLGDEHKASGNQEAAQLVGRKIAELCLSKNIDKVSFDRGGNIYHGRVKALADAAREGGLLF